MKENHVKQLWAQGQPALCGWISSGNAFVAEVMAAQGYDILTIDMQHGLADEAAALGILQSIRATAATPFVRVPWLDPAAIMKALDNGALGIICPMINSREQAEQLVSYVRYPPAGTRSFGPTRANFALGSDYAQHADEQILAFAMIETREAMQNLGEIVTTPGLDGVYIGPADLTLGLTGRRYPAGFDRQEPEIIEAIKEILHAAHDAGLRAALHCGSPSYARQAVEWGFDMVTVSNDVRLLASAAAASVAAFRDPGTHASAAANKTGSY
ncbi:MAG: aldolase/citrate lyase family protein [Pusillimonas sp.]